MSKQRKPSHAKDARHEGSSTDAAREVAVEPSNQEVARSLDPQAHASQQVTAEAVLEVAFPWLEQASLALHLEPRPALEIARMVNIIERSHFDRGHKDSLIDKIEGDQAAALAVQDALERAVGVLDEDTRSALIDTLDEAWTALSDGTVEGGQVHHGERSFDLGSQDGSAADRASELISSLVDGLGGERLAPISESGAGASVARFCRSVVLARAFDEEEEEEAFGSVGPAPEEG